MKMLTSPNSKRVFGLSVVVCFAKIFVCMCAVRNSGLINYDGVNATCESFCQDNTLNFSDPDHPSPNCTERCAYAAYTCTDGFINIQTPQPRCIPFPACNETNSCNLVNCSADLGHKNNGSEATPCYPYDSCAAENCDHGCINTANGSECMCLPGFVLEDDGSTCAFDNSSTFVRCDVNCSRGLCLNETCHCFLGYSHDGNETCTVKNSSFECVSKPRVCKDIDAGFRGNLTREHRNGTLNVDKTFREGDPCSLPSARRSCESQGKRCRPKDDGGFECYCSLPHHPVRGIQKNQSFCVSPATPVFLYRLSLVAIGLFDGGKYSTMRKLEADFNNRFFPSIVNCTVLNLEMTAFLVDPEASIAHLNFHASFVEELPYLGDLLADICATYPHTMYEDACILPGNIVVRKSEISYSEIENACDMDDTVSDFLCGPLARCKAGKGLDRYACDCIDGYRVDGYSSPKKPTCVDVDECLERPCQRPNQICKNQWGNYSCDCIPCYLWNKTRNECVNLCESNPCEHHGVCVLNELETGCGFHCVCRDEFKGLTCSETNDAIKAAKTSTAITGGILGAILGLTIIAGVLMVYMILKRTGYFSFRASKVTLR